VIERPTSEVAKVFELIRADTVPNLVICDGEPASRSTSRRPQP
jgi:hypothetical protein